MIEATFRRKIKHAPQFGRSTWKTILSPIGLAVLEKKGENLFCFGKNRILRKTQKNFFVWSFLFLLILNRYRLSFMAQKLSLKKMYFFSRCRFANLAFSGAIRLGIVLILTARIDQTSMHLWKRKSRNREKEIFSLGKRGSP